MYLHRYFSSKDQKQKYKYIYFLWAAEDDLHATNNLFCSLEQVWFSSPSLSEPVSIFLSSKTCFFKEMLATFAINVYVSVRENSCKISRAPYGVRLISYNAARCPAGDRPMLLVSYTDAGRRPYDMWPRVGKILKSWWPGDYQIRRWCANRWNPTMSVLYVTIA